MYMTDSVHVSYCILFDTVEDDLYTRGWAKANLHSCPKSARYSADCSSLRDETHQQQIK